MVLLSECQELVMTGSSTFGSVAAGLGGIAPVVMLPGAHADIDVSSRPSCTAETSSVSAEHCSGA